MKDFLKYPFIITLLFGSISVFSQNKHDANWCFGRGARVDFNDISNPIVSAIPVYNIEPNASYSDENGNLLFYIASSMDFNGFGYSDPFKILDANNDLILNGDSILIGYSATNGALIIPVPGNIELFYLFQVWHYQQLGCSSGICFNLYYSIIQKNILGTLSVVKKNHLLVQNVEERLAAVRSANGKGWWILAHAQRKDTTSPCSNRFYKFLIRENGLIDSSFQDIGTPHCHELSIQGEMIFSYDGRKLVSAILGDGIIDLFDFNRCTGTLLNHRVVDGNRTNFQPYGCAFSKNAQVLYASQGSSGGNDTRLYQYSLMDTNSPSSRLLIWSGTHPEILAGGQLELAPNGKVYFTCIVRGSTSNIFTLETQNLSVINFPDSLGLSCDFQPFSFYLGDSVRTSLGLPNMPNYNLGPTSIYAADAGEDTLYCTNQSNGVTIGAPPVEHIIYAWYPSHHLSDTTIAQPIASPTKDTWYYLSVTDTTQTTSCHTRTDSVFVRVDSCVTSVHSPQSIDDSEIKVYPNPASESMYVYSPMFNVSSITLTDLSGKEILRTSQTEISISHLAKGLYFVRVELENGEQAVQKVIIQ